jgi:hypothetical protein
VNGELFPSSHLAGVRPHSSFASLAEQAAAAEAWETPAWAAAAIHVVEICSHVVVDPCCGTGILSRAAAARGYDVRAADLYDWGYDCISALGQDFLTSEMVGHWCAGNTVLMNPPFSLATQFVDRALSCGARKVVCFQRQAWRESQTRRAWWEANPPARTWLCGDRATCWLFGIPPEYRKGGTPVPHAWYVWERGHKGVESVGAIWKDMVR